MKMCEGSPGASNASQPGRDHDGPEISRVARIKKVKIFKRIKGDPNDTCSACVGLFLYPLLDSTP